MGEEMNSVYCDENPISSISLAILSPCSGRSLLVGSPSPSESESESDTRTSERNAQSSPLLKFQSSLCCDERNESQGGIVSDLRRHSVVDIWSALTSFPYISPSLSCDERSESQRRRYL